MWVWSSVEWAGIGFLGTRTFSKYIAPWRRKLLLDSVQLPLNWHLLSSWISSNFPLVKSPNFCFFFSINWGLNYRLKLRVLILFVKGHLRLTIFCIPFIQRQFLPQCAPKSKSALMTACYPLSFPSHPGKNLGSFSQLHWMMLKAQPHSITPRTTPLSNTKLLPSQPP